MDKPAPQPDIWDLSKSVPDKPDYRAVELRLLALRPEWKKDPYSRPSIDRRPSGA
jgi:hypothetical protein